MTDPQAVWIGGDLGLIAYVFHGDSVAADRTWVCVRPEAASAGELWLGCWSSKEGRLSDPQLESFLTELCEVVIREARVGPMGPYISGHHFFDGWDTWDTALPMPLMNSDLDSIFERANRNRRS
jgi:hypothetical protein